MKKRPNVVAEKLKRLGLTGNEAKVYIALLELGRGTVSEISRKAGINRTTGYDVLDSLVSQGLVSISGKEPKQEYVAEPPDNLLRGLSVRIEEAQRDFEEAKSFIPELKSMQKVGDRPQVKFYEGVDGLKHVFEDSLTATSGKIIAFCSIDDQHAAIPGYYPAYYQRRRRAGIFMRALFPKTPASVERVAEDENEYRTSEFVPADKFAFHPAINVYDNKTMIASFREKLGIIIESEEIADAMKKAFELAWIGAYALDKDPSLAAKCKSAVADA